MPRRYTEAEFAEGLALRAKPMCWKLVVREMKMPDAFKAACRRRIRAQRIGTRAYPRIYAESMYWTAYHMRQAEVQWPAILRELDVPQSFRTTSYQLWKKKTFVMPKAYGVVSERGYVR